MDARHRDIVAVVISSFTGKLTFVETKLGFQQQLRQ
jgi:ABC-type ATPase with predicted acetyltransferase domain